jgi:hypothetical protein
MAKPMTLEYITAVRKAETEGAQVECDKALALIDANSDPTLDDYTDEERAQRAYYIDLSEAEGDKAQAKFMEDLAQLPASEKRKYAAQRQAARDDSDA